MPPASCLQCQHTLDVPDFVVYGVLQCPRCRRTFNYRSESASRTPAPAEALPASSSGSLLAAILAEPARTPLPNLVPTTPTRTPTPTGAGLPLLVEPHRCQHCKLPVRTPVGRPRATLTCPHADCQKPTSVYAIQFKCEHCGKLLEAPARLGGQVLPCPDCQRQTTVPHLELWNKAPWPDDSDFFGCECPSCSRRLVARRDDVGRPAVCPNCRVVVVVPNFGTALVDTRQPIQVDPRPGVKTERRLRCTECDSLIPATARQCPICLTPNRPSEYPT